MGRKTLNFLADEEVTETVRKYPCLYDKADKFYKDKRARRNAWKQIEEDLGMEEGMYNNHLFLYSNINDLSQKLKVVLSMVVICTMYLDCNICLFNLATILFFLTYIYKFYFQR